ncbi:MAG: hypothetical protein WCG47_03930 [Dermatophilaceae bacterium]
MIRLHIVAVTTFLLPLAERKGPRRYGDYHGTVEHPRITRTDPTDHTWVNTDPVRIREASGCGRA